MKVRKVAANAMDQQAEPAASQPSARELQRLEIGRQILDRLTDDSVVLSIDPEDEKASTLRARILRVAGDRGLDVAVQVRQEGGDPRLLVGLMTAERRSRRGRRPKAS